MRISKSCSKKVAKRVSLGALLNLSDETNAYILAVESQPDGFVENKYKTNTAINEAVQLSIYDKIAFWTKKTDFGRNFFFEKPLSMEKYLLKIEGSEVFIIDSSNDNDVLILGGATYKVENNDAALIPLTDQTITEGAQIGEWLGAGTNIERVFEDSNRIITQNISVDLYTIKIESTVQYKQTVNVEFEGFKFLGSMWLDKDKNIQASGTGQSIICRDGIFFHNGQYTPHVVLANINKSFMSKQYNADDIETTTVFIVDKVKYAPARILTQPDGYDSALTLSNHADQASLARQMAVHFGTSDAESEEYGTKGLTARGIKADWSVWAGEDAPDFPGFSTNEAYRNFLLSIKAIGSEIIPHAVHSGTVSLSDVIDLLPDYATYFQSSNYTDHGLGSAAINPGIASKGWDSEDEDNYMLDLFEANGFDKAWSYEDTSKERITGAIFNFPHNVAYFNDHLIMPSGEKVLLWKSSDRPFFYQWLDLDRLINTCDSIDAHDYIANVTRQTASGDSLISFDKTHYLDGSEYKITTAFDNLLALIAQKKAEGKIWNPSNTEFHEYFKKIKLVRLEIVSQKQYRIINSGDAINGFTVLICKSGIIPKLNGIEMNKKTAQLGTICWGNLTEGVNTLTY